MVGHTPIIEHECFIFLLEKLISPVWSWASLQHWGETKAVHLYFITIAPKQDGKFFFSSRIYIISPDFQCGSPCDCLGLVRVLLCARRPGCGALFQQDKHWPSIHFQTHKSSSSGVVRGNLPALNGWSLGHCASHHQLPPHTSQWALLTDLCVCVSQDMMESYTGMSHSGVRRAWTHHSLRPHSHPVHPRLTLLCHFPHTHCSLHTSNHLHKIQFL